MNLNVWVRSDFIVAVRGLRWLRRSHEEQQQHTALLQQQLDQQQQQHNQQQQQLQLQHQQQMEQQERHHQQLMHLLAHPVRITVVALSPPAGHLYLLVCCKYLFYLALLLHSLEIAFYKLPFLL